jgi:hypothetical protein
MKHTFTFKLIGNLDTDLLDQFKTFVVAQEYQTTNDFVEYAIRIRNIKPQEDIFKNFVSSCMSKYFKPEGHVGTNIARMEPNSYVSEHSDYTANTYGKMQDSIVKFQIPIITNSGAGMMWRHDKENRSAAMSFIEGGVYAIDNCRVHSSVNFNNEQRYWITTRWNINSLIDDSILI